MSEITVYTSNARVRILRPRPTESDEAFRTRMEAMIAVLTEHCSDTTAMVIDRDASGPICIVTQGSCPA